MKIQFFNIVKNRTPFLIKTDKPFEAYLENLSSSSKRFKNRSFKKYSSALVVISETISKEDLRIITRPEIKKHYSLSLSQYFSLITKPNVSFIKIIQNEELIACNFLWFNPQPNFGYVYSSCPYLSFSDTDLNFFLWVKSIEYICNTNRVLYLDIGFETEAKMLVSQVYELGNIQTFNAVISNRKKVSGFNVGDNNSKFLLLTKNEKDSSPNHFLTVVCKCGQKVLLDISTNGSCFACNSQLNNVIET